MNNDSQKITNLSQTIYQSIAKKFKKSVSYVGKIARKERTPTRGVGLDILKEIESYRNKD